MKKQLKRMLVMLALLAGIQPAGAQALISLYSFTNGNDGSFPQAALVQAGDGNFYGTASAGGTNGDGTFFRVTAVGILTPLYSFTGGNDGNGPNGLVQARDGNFYGTASAGGASGDGTVFRVTASGVLTPLYSFTGGHDGSSPEAGLVQAIDGNLYGTANVGGTNNYGTVFRITNSTLTPLYSFTDGHDGAYPQAALVPGIDGNLYGTTSAGGTNGFGTVFRITTNGVFTALYSFTGSHSGAYPDAGLVEASDGNLYGTAYQGGTNGHGTIFRLATSGVFTALYSFTGGHDGGDPEAGLVQGSDGYLYGTAYQGGTNNAGTVFRFTTNGILNLVYSFTLGNGSGPSAGLIQGKDGNFYGTAEFGGAHAYGTVFEFVLPPPVLNILPEGNKSFLYWLNSNTNYVLQSATNLSSPKWVTVSNGVQAIAGTATVTNSVPMQFFRLTAP